MNVNSKYIVQNRMYLIFFATENIMQDNGANHSV